MSLLLLILCLCLSLIKTSSTHSSWSKSDYRPKILTRNELSILTQTNSGDVFNHTLNSILIPRVSGTPNNFKVYNVIKSHYEDLGWDIQEDLFTDNTPLGAKEFRNLVVTLNPGACKRLVFACHYDSKYFPTGNFVGATDSAVPCAMLMAMASDLDWLLKAHRQSSPAAVTLQFIFFDGEEAFVEWSNTDSLYGSRHLAEKMNRTPVTPAGACGGAEIVSEIDRIELFVLLDLLGAAKPSFYSYFPDTDVYYARMITIENDLNSGRLMRSPSSSTRGTTFFKNRRSFGMIEDDHIPFMRKGVRILHLITSPFPSVWHKMSDDASALHHPTIRDLMSIFKSFMAEFLHLEVSRS